MTTTALLQRIGLDRAPAGPSAEGLFVLHRAFVMSIPYESVQYQFGGGGPLDPRVVADRMIAREAGGYCFQMNGAFALLLGELGYQVTMHRGGVQTRSVPAPRVDSTHLVLTVTGLPEAPEQVWLVDAGLGDGLLEPLPLEVGSSWQAPYTFGLGPSSVTAGWRLEHDARSVIAGIDTLETQSEYYELLADVFELPLPHLGPAQRDHLWRRVVQQYDDYLARSG